VIDWLIVSGRINMGKTAINNFFKLTENITHKFLLPTFRVFIFFLLCLALQKSNSFSLLINEITLSKAILIISLLLSALMILLGILGRFFAIILSCLLCWFFLSYEMQIFDAILLILVIYVMQFGTGKFSLWLWDDLWVHRYDGA